MIKRVLTILILIICNCLYAVANKDIEIRLDQDKKIETKELGFANLTFEYSPSYGNITEVQVSVENVTFDPPHAILLFKNSTTENILKKRKPKVKFDKHFPGKRGTRNVEGTANIKNITEIISATETDEIFSISVPYNKPQTFTITLYEAKYKPKTLIKKGKNNTDYTILEKHVYNITLTVVGWTRNDATYVKTKNKVQKFISDVNKAEFCNNKNHYPNLTEQQKPYLRRQDELTTSINEILLTLHNANWLSTDEPYIAYSELLHEVQNVNLNSRVSDCGKHKRSNRAGNGHSCSYCSLSVREIYYRLDELYQQLHAGKIDKANAANTAKQLYTCYQRNNTRSKDSIYGTKITRFYNSITNY